MIKIVNKSSNPMPEYATKGAAAFDLRAFIEAPIIVQPMERIVVKTGLYMQLPPGTVGLVCPRSGLAAKNGITVTNAPGVIDEDYTGEIMVILNNTSTEDFFINNGDRIAQMMIMEYKKMQIQELKDVKEFNETVRGENGFGSTGTN